jgi:hypothetical protein
MAYFNTSSFLQKLSINNRNAESITYRAPEKRDALLVRHVTPGNACGA